ncbi:MAG TPA: DinB family protein [Chitinophagaceae bacterium]|jgi:DinB superfamily|nr:DinB family protein [Chitinophagaceae bacterium]
MKSLLLLITFLSGAAFMHPLKDSITDAERQFAVKEFQRTKERFLNDIKGLSPQQLSFKADTSRWSIAQCIEHIALAENALWKWEQGTMMQAAAPEKAAEVKVTNEQILKGITDRTHTFKAPEMLQPVGRFPSTDAAIHAYMGRRDSTITYLMTTKDDLKNHFTMHPAMGTINTYQLLLFLSGHSERHSMQIEEVKANPAFPKQ